MPTTEPRLFDPTVIAIPYYLALMLLEVAVLRRRRRAGDRSLRGYERRDTRASLFAGATALVAWIPINLATLAGLRWAWEYRLFDLGTGWLGWSVAMIGWDLSFYWQHRAEHEIRFLWAGHVTHHNSEHYNLSTALRQSWTPVSSPVLYPVWALLGVHPALVMVSGGLNLIYQFWIHTEAIERLPGWFEAIGNTPSHHRVHHGANPQYLDKNYGGVLIVWDRLFGTFEPEREPVRYGITRNIHSFDPLWIQLHEYVGIWRDARAARSWRDRLGYVFRGPGWAPATPRQAGAPRLHVGSPT